MINKAFLLVVVAVLTSLFITSCEEVRDPCLEPTTVALVFGTYQPADTGSAGKKYELPKAVLGWVDTPSVYYNGVKASSFPIRLSSIADSSRWYIWPDSAATTGIDTVTFFYERKPRFLSTACGYIFTYSLKNVTSTNYNIDSIKITNTEVNTDANIEHVKIFF